MKKIGILIAVLLTLLVVAGCQNKKDTQNTKKLIVGATPVQLIKTFFKNKFINFTGGFVINIIRSTPFVILLVLLIPFTNICIVTGKQIGRAHV